jgi:hypothetical protein
MKQLLLPVLICLTSVTSSLQSYYPENSRRSTSCGEILLAAAAVAGIAGLTYCVIKQEPYDLLDKAKNSYNSIDRKTLRLFERYSSGTYDVANLAAMIYIRSAYSLVAAAQSLETARGETQEALRMVRKALSLLQEEFFVSDCNRLKHTLYSRLEIIEELIIKIHTHPLWPQYYSLYLQATNVREVRYLQDRVDDLTWQRQQPVTYLWEEQPSYVVFENQVLWY